MPSTLSLCLQWALTKVPVASWPSKHNDPDSLVNTINGGYSKANWALDLEGSIILLPQGEDKMLQESAGCIPSCAASLMTELVPCYARQYSQLALQRGMASEGHVEVIGCTPLKWPSKRMMEQGDKPLALVPTLPAGTQM